MADQAELDIRIARLDAALTATADALERVLAEREAGQGADAAADPEDLARAQARIEELEAMLREREEALSAATARATAAEESANGRSAEGSPGDDATVTALRSELADMKAARSQDLAEMKALLAELEPMLESADA